MRYNPAKATEDWQLLEAVKNGRYLCSDEYSDANEKELADIFAALRMLQAAGCPPDKTLGNPEIEAVKVKCRGSHKKTQFYVLKAKPSGWRLYFRVRDRAQKQLEFLTAVHKKKNARNNEDFDRCCSVADELDAGRAASETLFVPPR